MATIQARAFDGAGQQFATSSLMDVTKWVVLHITRDSVARTSTFYVNGSPLNPTGTNGTSIVFIGTYANLSLSAFNTSSAGYVGNPSGVQYAAFDIYNTILTPAQIAREFSRYRTEFPVMFV
jgi:hypothetical protein